MISTRIFIFYRVGVMNWAVPIKKKSDNGHLSIQIQTLKSIIDGPQIQGPHPQNRIDRIGLVHF